jgi:protein involved in polysaccharide export with SLBB domain
MKTRVITILVWLAGASWAVAQPYNGPTPINQMYGAGPSTPSQMFQTQQPSSFGQTALPVNATANTTSKSTTKAPVPAPAGAADTSTPDVTSDTPAAAAPVLAPASAPYSGGDLANFHMPETMEQIDNDPNHQLAVRDQFVYQVLQDHEKPQILYVDENGEISVPFLPELHIQMDGSTQPQVANKLKVEGHTLYYVAREIQQLLTDPNQVPDDPNQPPDEPKTGYYKQATVLLAFYQGNVSRGHVNVIGEVLRPGPVDVPANSVLTLWDAINKDAGGFKDDADKEHVQLIHHDADDSKRDTNQEINIQTFIDQGREADIVVQPGDFINVPSRSQRAQDNIVVTGEVNSPAVLPPPNGAPLYLSEVMIKVGWTPYSNHTVELVRYKDGKKTTENHNVDDVLVRGDKDKDVQLQPGDHIIVKQNWFSSIFGN